MSFLAPLFLLGGLLVAGPIVAHLIRRSTSERVLFSTTRFLERSAPRLTRRSRIQNPWLLALRCLVVLILCAGFSRPFFDREIPLPPPVDLPQHVVIVLDESASMQRRGLWEAAGNRVRAIAQSMGPEDRLAIVTAGVSINTLVPAERWAQTPLSERETMVINEVTGRSPGWGPTHLDLAVEAGLEELATMDESGEGAPGKIVIVSDFTMGARVSGLAGRTWPPGTEVELAPVTTGQPANASLQSLGWTTTSDGQRAARLRVTLDQDEPDTLRLQLHDALDRQEIGEARMVALAARESRVVLVEVPPSVTNPVRAEIAGDSEPYDNSVWLVPDQPRELTIPFLGRQTPEDSQHALFYLTRAIAGWKNPVVTFEAFAPSGTPALPASPVLVVGEALDASTLAAVRSQVAAGALVLVLATDADAIATAARLVGEDGWSEGSITRSDALLGEIDFQHPLFAAFADPRFSDFTRVRFWRPVPINLPEDSAAKVLARFENGSPAVVETEVERGRVVVWGGDWSTRASQWVLSSKFVPWLQGFVERAIGGPPRPATTDFGELAPLLAGEPAQWRAPRDRTETFSATAPTEPGIYELEQSGHRRWVALQPPAIESRNEPLPYDTWEQLGVPLEAGAVITATPDRPETASVSASISENQQQLWRWLLIAATVFLAIESFAAFKAARRTASAQA